MSQNRLKNMRSVILSILGILIIIVAFSLSKSIANSNPPSRKEASKVVKDVYFLEVKNNAFYLRERAPGVSVEEIKVATEGTLIIEGDIPEMIL